MASEFATYASTNREMNRTVGEFHSVPRWYAINGTRSHFARSTARTSRPLLWWMTSIRPPRASRRRRHTYGRITAGTSMAATIPVAIRCGSRGYRAVRVSSDRTAGTDFRLFRHGTTEMGMDGPSASWRYLFWLARDTTTCGAYRLRSSCPRSVVRLMVEPDSPMLFSMNSTFRGTATPDPVERGWAALKESPTDAGS